MGEETNEIKNMMGIGPKVHTESLSGPHSLSGRSHGSGENDEDDDQPEEQESSDDEANHPKPLRKYILGAQVPYWFLPPQLCAFVLLLKRVLLVCVMFPSEASTTMEVTSFMVTSTSN